MSGRWSLYLVRLVLLAAPLSVGSSSPPDFRVSLSVHGSDDIFREGYVFTDGEIIARSTEELQRLFVKYGSTETFARLNTTRAAMEGALEKARLAKRLDLAFGPQIGLWGTYGARDCQPPPDFGDYPEAHFSGYWSAMTLEAMLPKLRAYGAAVSRAFAATGVRVSMYQLGNETEYGLAGIAPQPIPGGCYKDDHYRAPDAVDQAIGKRSVSDLVQMSEAERITWLQSHLWPYEARMLAAVTAGIRSVDPQAKVSTTISGPTSLQPKLAVAFFTSLMANGFALDEAGFSYNPTSITLGNDVDRVKAFRQTATAVREAIGRQVFIAEFAFPAAPLARDHLWRHPVPGYPMTAEGQARFIYDLVRWGIDSRVLSGLRPWAPDGINTGEYLGKPWGPMALFEVNGNKAIARPALKEIRRALRGASF
jgi:Glycosyl hydrolase family 53